MNYLGNARVHKYYDASIFIEELKCIREGLSCEGASEREFEMALAQTSHRISHSWAGRSIVDHYQGTQSIVHKTDEARLHYTINNFRDHHHHMHDRQRFQ